MAAVSVSKPLQEASTFLENYWNRNQVFRTVQYASILFSGLLEQRFPGGASKFAAVSRSLSNMRTALRLMDDVPNLARTLSTWRQQKDPSLVIRLTDLLSTLSGLLYYPTEHIAWAADLKILPIESNSLWNFSIILWIVSLISSCVRHMVILWRVGKEIRTLQRQVQVQSSSATPQSGSSRNGNGRKRVTFQDEATSSETRLRVLRRIHFQSAVSLLKSTCDMMNAIHWLPSGVLWSEKLPTVLVGVFGTTSSLLGLYQILPQCRQRPSTD